VLAFAIITAIPSLIPLPVTFYAILLKNKADADDLRADDSVGVRNLESLDWENPSFISQTYGLDDGDPIPTLASELVDIKKRYYPSSPQADAKMEAFRDGFNSLLPIDEIKTRFSPASLRGLVTLPDILVEDLIKEIDVEAPYAADKEPVAWLFEWLRAADQQTLRKFVNFVTGLATVPPQGLRSTGKGILIRAGSGLEIPGAGGLCAPQSHTCFFYLDLPQYQSKSDLDRAMRVAIDSEGFGFI
jgi:hypothetical protein